MASNKVVAPTNPLSFDEDSICLQEESVLFNLPGEVRDRIFEFALCQFEDKSQIYDTHTFWARPQYLAPRRSDTRLLRTCKRAYNEGWFRPWTSAMHTFWLTDASRAPEEEVALRTTNEMIEVMAQIEKRHGYVEIDQIRVFAQLWALEPGRYLQKILEQPNFYPRTITITVRHTDFWYWENDDQLYIAAEWVNHCIFPSSTQEIRLEMETIDRKKAQVDSLAEQMKKEWYFKTTGKLGLFANDTTDEIDTWQGSSTFASNRWIRDEKKESPGLLDYYIRTVIFRIDPRQSIAGRPQARRIRNQAQSGQLRQPHPCIHTELLRQAGVSEDSPAQKALDEYLAWQRKRASEREESYRRTQALAVNNYQSLTEGGLGPLFAEADVEDEDQDQELVDDEDDENDQDYLDEEDESMEDVEDHGDEYGDGSEYQESNEEHNADLDVEDLQVIAEHAGTGTNSGTIAISSGPSDEQPLYLVGPDHILY